MSLDGVYDCRRNRKAIFNRGIVPNINPNPSGRKSAKRGRKPFFDAAIFKERFNTIERVFGWEDKFRRLLLRFERLSQLHYAFKTLAYAMINLRASPVDNEPGGSNSGDPATAALGGKRRFATAIQSDCSTAGG